MYIYSKNKLLFSYEVFRFFFSNEYLVLLDIIEVISSIISIISSNTSYSGLLEIIEVISSITSIISILLENYRSNI